MTTQDGYQPLYISKPITKQPGIGSLVTYDIGRRHGGCCIRGSHSAFCARVPIPTDTFVALTDNLVREGDIWGDWSTHGQGLPSGATHGNPREWKFDLFDHRTNQESAVRAMVRWSTTTHHHKRQNDTNIIHRRNRRVGRRTRWQCTGFRLRCRRSRYLSH